MVKIFNEIKIYNIFEKENKIIDNNLYKEIFKYMIVVNARFLTQRVTGVQRYAIELSIELKKLFGKEIVFVAPSCGIIQTECAKELGVVTIGSHTGHLWEQWDLPRYLKKLGSPLLVSLCNTAPILYRNKVSALHDILFIRYPRTFSRSFVLFYRMLVPLVLKTSRHIVTVSEFSKNEISSFYGVDKDKISVVYNAVSDAFMNMGKSFSPNGDKYFIAVSSVKENKNFPYILEAFTKLSVRRNDIKLFVIGDVESKSFRSLDISGYLSNPYIKTLGRVSDEELVNYYRNSQCLLFPSLYEGFGIPPLEAQACGCPAICANATCLPEIYGDSVLYCDPYDTDSIVEAMENILEDEFLCKKMAEKGYMNVKRYSWKESARTLKNILEKYTLN